MTNILRKKKFTTPAKKKLDSTAYDPVFVRHWFKVTDCQSQQIRQRMLQFSKMVSSAIPNQLRNHRALLDAVRESRLKPFVIFLMPKKSKSVRL
jgi:hypothetical protein